MGDYFEFVGGFITCSGRSADCVAESHVNAALMAAVPGRTWRNGSFFLDCLPFRTGKVVSRQTDSRMCVGKRSRREMSDS